MSLERIHNKQRWTLADYQEALIELKSAQVEYQGKTYKLFKGLTKKNGFDVNKPQNITRSKRHTIKRLLSDLAVIRSRQVAIVSTRSSRRKYYAKKQSGFRSPYMNVIPLPVVPDLQTKITWKNDRPIVTYPRQGIRAMTVSVEKAPIRRAMRAAFERGDDADDAIIDVVRRQIRRSVELMAIDAKPGDMFRFRLRTIYGDLEAGKAIGISTDIEDLLNQLSAFISEYLEKDKEGNFFIGFTIWVINRDEQMPDTFKPIKERTGAQHGKRKKYGRSKADKRRRSIGRG